MQPYSRSLSNVSPINGEERFSEDKDWIVSVGYFPYTLGTYVWLGEPKSAIDIIQSAAARYRCEDIQNVEVTYETAYDCWWISIPTMRVSMDCLMAP